MVAHGTRTHRGALAPAVLLAVVLVVGAACGGSNSDSQPSARNSTTSASATATTSATASRDPKAEAASQGAVAAYLGYVRAFAAASQVPDPDYPGLARYVNQPLLSRTRHELGSMRDKGVVQVGAQTATVTATSVDLASDQPSVTVHACLDYSALRLVYKSNHVPVPNSQLKKTKVSAVATVWLFVNGQWMVTDTKDGTAPC
jgi:hypothetical protein